jgi:hypothetical protein
LEHGIQPTGPLETLHFACSGKISKPVSSAIGAIAQCAIRAINRFPDRKGWKSPAFDSAQGVLVSRAAFTILAPPSFSAPEDRHVWNGRSGTRFRAEIRL